jgi:hypothetical protein
MLQMKSYFNRNSLWQYSDEKLINYLHDKNYIQADLYAIFHRIMKLGVKQLYMEHQAKLVRGKPEIEDSGLFFAPTMNVSQYSFLYVRSYRILSVLLKKLDNALYENLHRKRLDPPIIFLYSFTKR